MLLKGSTDSLSDNKTHFFVGFINAEINHDVLKCETLKTSLSKRKYDTLRLDSHYFKITLTETQLWRSKQNNAFTYKIDVISRGVKVQLINP